MTSSIPQATPPSAYERFVVTPVSKVVRVAIAFFKFIAAIVTWPLKAIYRLFVPSEQKPKEQEGTATTGAVVPPAATAGAVAPLADSTQAFKLNFDQRGEQDFSTALKELIESELQDRPLVEKEELEQITKDSSRSTLLKTLEGSKTQNYNRQQFQDFLDFLVASTNDDHLLRSPLYFYLSQTPPNILVGQINNLLMEKGFYLGTHRDGQQTLKVESLVSELKTESTYTMCICAMEGEVFKNCVLSLKATINRTTLAVELKATIELKNPVIEVEKTLHLHNNINSLDSEDEEPVVPPYSALEKKIYENIKASILGTDETLWARMARETIKKEQKRQQSIPFGPVAPIITPAPSDTQNSATAKKAKADVYRPVATEFLKNIIDRAVAQLSKGGRLKLFLFILANVKINRRGEDLKWQIH